MRSSTTNIPRRPINILPHAESDSPWIPSDQHSFNASAAEISKQLSDISSLLAEVDQRSSSRLQDLAVAISSESGRQRWSDVDLRRAFNTDRLAHAYAVRHEGGYAPKRIEVADKLRNVLVLLPILLTWWAIGAAVRNHAQFVAEGPENASIPFLVAWEQGFGGRAGLLSPSLSHVAFVDAILIALIIGLTFYAHGRSEAQEDLIADTTSLFQADMDNALAEASVLLATDRVSRPVRLADAMERMADSFDENSHVLLTQLQAEYDRMEFTADRREKEFADFGVFAQGMRSGAEELHRMVVGTRDMARGLERALQDLASDLARSAEQQRSLLLAVSNLEQLTTSSDQNDQAIVRQLAQTSTRLEEVARKAIALTEQSNQANRMMMETVTFIGDAARDISSNQAQIDQIIATQQGSNAQLAEALRQADTTSKQTIQLLASALDRLAPAAAGHQRSIHPINDNDEPTPATVAPSRWARGRS